MVPLVLVWGLGFESDFLCAVHLMGRGCLLTLFSGFAMQTVSEVSQSMTAAVRKLQILHACIGSR